MMISGTTDVSNTDDNDDVNVDVVVDDNEIRSVTSLFVSRPSVLRVCVWSISGLCAFSRCEMIRERRRLVASVNPTCGPRKMKEYE